MATRTGCLFHDQNLNAHVNEAVNVKAKNLESNSRAANKASEKSQTGRRKALGDISNQVPVMKNKNSLKMMTTLIEEPLIPSEIAEEQFLHNHQMCIKSQFETVMDVRHFFKTVGLENDSDDHKHIAPLNCLQSVN